MGSIVAVASPQGGAAKSTTVMLLAETLASQWGKSVLVIDSDPQARLSMLFLPDKRWEEAETQERTLVHFLQRAIEQRRLPDIDATLASGASNVEGAESLVLMPGHPVLALLEWQAARDEDILHRLQQVLKHFITIVRDQFDLVLVDCPATLNELTQSWLALAHGCLMPLEPDPLAARCLLVLRAMRQELAARHPLIARDLGVLIAQHETDVTSHMVWYRRLKRDPANRCFPVMVPRHPALERTPDGLDGPLAFEQKYPDELAAIAIATAKTLLARLA